MMNNNQFINPWTKEEIEKIFEYYPSLYPQEVEFIFPNRTSRGVRVKACTLNILKESRKIYNKIVFNDDYMGGYISGLTDGEGCFSVALSHQYNRTFFSPRFQINLRSDDIEILYKIKDYFHAGNIKTYDRKKSIFNSKPISCFDICDCYNLMRSVIPHFEKYPLQAKKKGDYIIWKKMVLWQNENYNKPYSDEFQEQMKFLYQELKKNREYKIINNNIDTLIDVDDKAIDDKAINDKDFFGDK